MENPANPSSLQRSIIPKAQVDSVGEKGGGTGWIAAHVQDQAIPFVAGGLLSAAHTFPGEPQSVKRASFLRPVKATANLDPLSPKLVSS